MQSKPGPILAIEAGTLTRITVFALQLQDLSEYARIAVELDWRLDILQRRGRGLEPGAGQDDHRRRVLLDLALANQPEQQRERGSRRGLREEALSAGQS